MANPTVIYRFTNATLIKGSGMSSSDLSLLDDGEPLALERNLLSSEVLKDLGAHSYRLHRQSHGELRLERLEWSQEVVSYIPKDSSTELRELSEDEHSRLSASFQKLYRQQLTAPVETRKVLDFELKEIGYPLSESVLLGLEYPTELHGIVLRERAKAARLRGWGSYDSKPRPQLDRNLPLELEGADIFAAIDFLSDKILSRGSFGAQVQVRSSAYSDRSIRISFLASRYEGAMKKVLSTKANGQHYADRRGRMVRDLPTTVGTAEISEGELVGWWKSIGGNQLSDGDKLEALSALTRKLWVL